jgi:hypothetical protein
LSGLYQKGCCENERQAKEKGIESLQIRGKSYDILIRDIIQNQCNCTNFPFNDAVVFLTDDYFQADTLVLHRNISGFLIRIKGANMKRKQYFLEVKMNGEYLFSSYRGLMDLKTNGTYQKMEDISKQNYTYEKECQMIFEDAVKRALTTRGINIED